MSLMNMSMDKLNQAIEDMSINELNQTKYCLMREYVRNENKANISYATRMYQVISKISTAITERMNEIYKQENTVSMARR